MRGRLCTVVFLFLAMAAICLAQTGTSRIAGTVTDQTGAVVAGATVMATNQGTSVTFTTRTSPTGTYSFESIQLGIYRIEVQMSGFKTFSSKDNVLNIGQPMTVNAKLEVGAATENVQVEASAETVQTSSSGNFGNVVSSQAITELPIVNSRGRNPLDLVNFQPGVVNGSNAGGGVHVHGARDRAWDYTLDGIDVNETSSGGANYTPLKVNPDMLAEFRVVTGNASPEMGRASGGQVQMVTKSGSNSFHGDASFLYQTPGLNANSVSNKSVGLGRPMFVQKIGSFSLGGPIQKNRTFFYGNFSFLRTILTSKVTSMVYTQQARQGNFRYVIDPNAECGDDCLHNMPYGSGGTVDQSGNVLPGFNVGTYNVGAMDPAGIGLDQRVLDYIGTTPLPNDFTVGDGLNLAGFSWNSPENHKENNYIFKIDHNFSDRSQVFARYAWGHQNTMGDSVNGGQPPFPGTPNWVDTYRLPRNLAINWRFTPNGHMTNEFVVGMNRFGFYFANGASDYQNNPPFWLNDITQPLYNDAGNRRTLTTYQMNDNFSITKGAHTFRMGASIYYARHIDNRGSIGSYNANPLIYFDTGTNPVSDAVFGIPGDMNYDYDRPTLKNAINNLLGRVGEIDQGFVSDGTQWQPGGTWFNFDFRMPEYDFYVQDSWKVSRNLVIDAGLRWEIKMAPYNTHDLLLQPDQPMVYNATPSDTVKWVPGTLWDNQYKNLAPSIGFAWDPFGTGKTSIRANYRIAYDRINTFVVSSSIGQKLPGLTYWTSSPQFGNSGGRLSDCSNLSLTITCGGMTVGPPSGLTPESLRTPPPFSTDWTTVMDPNMVTPRTHMWGMSVQRDLGRNMVLELNYLGRHGQNLFGAHDANAHEIFKNGFLEAFNTVKGGGNSPLIDQLMNGYWEIAAGGYENGSDYLRGEFGTSLRRNNVSNIAKFINQLYTNDGSQQLLVANGFSPYFFVRFPQYADEVDTLDTHDISWYHAFEAQLQRRMSNGLQFQMSYTWAKSLDTRSFDPTFTTIATGNYQSSSSTPFDAAHREYNYAPSDFDRKHALQGEVIYELPFGRGKLVNIENPVLNKVLGGFQVAGILTLQSGRPFTVYSGAYTYNRTIMTPASCDGCSPNMGSLQWRGEPFAGGSDMYYFTPEQASMFYQPAAGTLSNLGRNYFRLPHTFNLDMAIAKKITVREGKELELRLDMQNMTNSVMYDLPYSSTITSSMFGYMTGQQSNGPRTMQLVAKFTF